MKSQGFQEKTLFWGIVTEALSCSIWNWGFARTLFFCFGLLFFCAL